MSIRNLGLFLPLLLTACALNTLPPSSPTASPTHAPAPSASPTITPVQATGKLTGRVTIGPLRPVERIGEPTLTPPPEVFTSRSINIFAADGVTLIANVKINPDGTYAVTLPAGTIIVDLARTGIDHARNLPKTITIEAGQTVQLDIDIDTGIR